MDFNFIYGRGRIRRTMPISHRLKVLSRSKNERFKGFLVMFVQTTIADWIRAFGNHTIRYRNSDKGCIKV